MYIVRYKHHPAGAPYAANSLTDHETVVHQTLDDARHAARTWLRAHNLRGESYYIARVEEIAAWSDVIDIQSVG